METEKNLKEMSDSELLGYIKWCEDKERANDIYQQSFKILLNSGYGAVGNSYFAYFLLENAEAITSSGQLINKWTARKLNIFLNEMFNDTDEPVDYVVYGDTDSLYLTLQCVIDKAGYQDKPVSDKVSLLDSFHKDVLDDKIKEWCQELADYMNSYEQRMFWGREIIAESCIWQAKKRYAAAVWNSEGVAYPKPKIKVMGLEAVKSSTAAWARGYLKECYEIGLMFDEEALHTKLTEIREVFDSKTIDEIAIPTGVNFIDKYSDPVTITKKGAQKHIRSVIYHNHLIDKHGYDNIAKIQDATKIKYVDLKMPNPSGFDAIGFEGHLPEEFGLDNYVNRNIIYEKSFIKPLQLFLDAIGWDSKPRANLTSFFNFS